MATIGQYDLLLVAARSVPTTSARRAYFTWSLVAQSTARLRSARRFISPAREVAAKPVSSMFRSMDMSITKPLGAAVLGHQGESGGHGQARSSRRKLPAEHLDLTAVEPVDAEDRAGHFTATRPDQTGEAEDLAAPDVEGDVGEHAFARQPAHAEGDLADPGLLLGVELLRIAADHAAHQTVLVEVGQGFTGDPGTIPKGGDPLAQLEDLLQAVRDEQHRRSLLAQRSRPRRTAGPPRCR